MQKTSGLGTTTSLKFDISATAGIIFKSSINSESLDSDLEDTSEDFGLKMERQQVISNESVACAVVAVVDNGNDLKICFVSQFPAKNDSSSTGSKVIIPDTNLVKT